MSQVRPGYQRWVGLDPLGEPGSHDPQTKDERASLPKDERACEQPLLQSDTSGQSARALACYGYAYVLWTNMGPNPEV